MQDESGSGVEPPFDRRSTDTDPRPTGNGRTPTSRRRLAVVGTLVALVAGTFTLVALRPEADPASTTTPSSTTTTAPTTTSSTIPELAAGTSEIAVAKEGVSIVHVSATEPEGWAEAEPAVRLHMPEAPPASQATVPARAALPRPDFPIQGRYAVDGGWEFESPGPYEPDQPFTVLVTERRGEWAKVLLPVRPNGTQGWVSLDEVDLTTTRHRIEIRLGERMLRAYDGPELIAETQVVVGTAATQTPTGRFALTDRVPQANPGGAVGPVALATTAYSEMMDVFDTGVPVVALHGTNRPELVGQAVSNGCVRVPNEVITLLADTLPQGTPVDVWP